MAAPNARPPGWPQRCSACDRQLGESFFYPPSGQSRGFAYRRWECIPCVKARARARAHALNILRLKYAQEYESVYAEQLVLELHRVEANGEYGGST